MSASVDMELYEKWLTEKLLSLNPETDTDVFVSYITGILDEDSPEDEKKESLLDILGQVLEENQDAVCDELFQKWEEIHGGQSQTKTDNSAELTNHLASILEHQKIESVKTKKKTAEDIARKQAILAQYSTVGSGEEDDGSEDGGDSHAAHGDNLMDFKNVNSEVVKNREQEMREKSKQESEKKKEKDKQDREAQKQKQKDRKETEKKRTQKGEKRR